MTTFVLVHGAWHGAWCWELVSEALQGKGHKVIAPDLPGMGADKTPLKDVSLASWADHVCGLIRPLGEKVVLAGHSRGGVVIVDVDEEPSRIDFDRVPELRPSFAKGVPSMRARIIRAFRGVLVESPRALADKSGSRPRGPG